MIYNVYDLDVQAYCLYPKFTITITTEKNLLKRHLATEA